MRSRWRLTFALVLFGFLPLIAYNVVRPTESTRFYSINCDGNAGLLTLIWQSDLWGKQKLRCAALIFGDESADSSSLMKVTNILESMPAGTVLLKINGEETVVDGYIESPIFKDELEPNAIIEVCRTCNFAKFKDE